jgi:hypothetical protein
MLREKNKNFKLLKGAESECDGLFTNRLLWLSASAGALPPTGLRLAQPRPTGAFLNKPYPFSPTPDLIPFFAELDAYNYVPFRLPSR